jgi:hypothetical protein
MRLGSGLLVIVTGIFLLSAAALAEQAPPAQGAQAGGGRGAPQPLQNIKVLPKEWTRQQVQALMLTFVESLGVAAPAGAGCAHCHATNPDAAPAQPGGRGPALDYALDTNPRKDVARKMIQMAMAANSGFLKDVGDGAAVEKASCWTCHRGTTKPEMTPPNGWARGGFSLLPSGPPANPNAGRGGPGGGAPGGGRGGN